MSFQWSHIPSIHHSDLWTPVNQITSAATSLVQATCASHLGGATAPWLILLHAPLPPSHWGDIKTCKNTCQVPVPTGGRTTVLWTIASGGVPVILDRTCHIMLFLSRSIPWLPISLDCGPKTHTVLVHYPISYNFPSHFASLLNLWPDSFSRAFACTIPTFWSVTLQDPRIVP